MTKGHGRLETRQAFVISDPAALAYLNERQRWAQLSGVAMVEAERILNGVTTIEQRYYVLSQPWDAATVNTLVRGHWRIENQVHDVNQILPLISDPSLKVFIDVRKAQFTTRDLIRAQDTAAQLAKKLELKADLSIDVINNRVDIYTLNLAQFSEALQRFQATLPETVVVRVTPALAQPAADIRGGYALTTCTTGFSVKNSSGTKGIATAGYCSNMQAYASTKLPFQSPDATSGSYDIQWHTTSIYTPINQIFIGSSNRTITALKNRSSQAIGETVCKYGKTTGYTCGQIVSKSYQPSGYISGALATFIRVSATNVVMAQAGDSGGPWFFSNTAYGITSGSIGLRSTQADTVYMAVDYVTGFGLTILTS